MSEPTPTQITYVPIGTIQPYENNPRRIPQDAISAVAKSLELYGWQQPIVVDKDNVIVVGHTRRLAAQSLGMTEVPVMVTHMSPEKIKEYRLVDNRTAEYGTWDHNALVMELREFEQSLIDSFFPDVDLEIALVRNATAPTDEEIERAQNRSERVKDVQADTLHLTEVVCPSCFHTFHVRTKSLPAADRALMEALVDGGQQ